MTGKHTLEEQRRDTPEMVRELTSHHVHVERVTTRTGHGTVITEPHRVIAPPLLDQLGDATPSADGHSSYGGYGSRPTANLEALDLRAEIDRAALNWIAALGDWPDAEAGRPEPIVGTLGRVRKAGSLEPRMKPCKVEHHQRRDGCCLTHDIRRWWTRARIITGWDGPAWKPDNTCPVCGQRGSLRIRLTDQAAYCTNVEADGGERDGERDGGRCGATWDSSTIGLLAEHIRDENHDEISGYVASFG